MSAPHNIVYHEPMTVMITLSVERRTLDPEYPHVAFLTRDNLKDAITSWLEDMGAEVVTVRINRGKYCR